MFTIEDLDKALTHKNIEFRSFADNEEFDRNREFNVDGDYYLIQWWSNISYLFIGKAIIPFNRVCQSGTWPNEAKVNLQFSRGGTTCCIIPIENYPKSPSSAPDQNSQSERR